MYYILEHTNRRTRQTINQFLVDNAYKSLQNQTINAE